MLASDPDNPELWDQQIAGFDRFPKCFPLGRRACDEVPADRSSTRRSTPWRYASIEQSWSTSALRAPTCASAWRGR
jgi:hypothetical protein